MNIRKGNLPESVERDVTVEFNRDEIISVLVNFVATKGTTINMTDIQVVGSPDGKLASVILSGKETVPCNWG